MSEADFSKLKNKNVVYVEDDPDARMLVKTILEAKGLTVTCCADGKEGLETLKTLKPALVILDIMMPGLSGYDVAIAMKQKPETQNIPIIMLTAKEDPEDVLKGYKDYGVEYYITKPFTTKQLIAGVKLVLTDSED
jgi:CheY-like chemotaxis protein